MFTDVARPEVFRLGKQLTPKKRAKINDGHLCHLSSAAFAVLDLLSDDAQTCLP